MELYAELCAERQRIMGAEDDARREAIRKERLAKDLAERHKQEQQETVEVGIVTFILCIAVGAVVWFLIEVM
jgi:hypothetical protein